MNEWLSESVSQRQTGSYRNFVPKKKSAVTKEQVSPAELWIFYTLQNRMGPYHKGDYKWRITNEDLGKKFKRGEECIKNRWKCGKIASFLVKNSKKKSRGGVYWASHICLHTQSVSGEITWWICNKLSSQDYGSKIISRRSAVRLFHGFYIIT